MRLIDADALLEALNKQWHYIEFDGDKDVIEAITNAPTVQREGWVSIEDAPPNRIEGIKILCFGNGYIFESEYEDGLWVNIGGDDFTHWQPLPELPTLRELNEGN